MNIHSIYDKARLHEYELLLEHSSELILFFTKDGSIVQYNKAVTTELGYNKEIKLITISDIFRKVMRINKGQIEYLKSTNNKSVETVAYRKNQTCFPVDLKVIFEEREHEYYGVCIATNISAKKDALAYLGKAKKDIVYAEKTKNEFVANITHELRTPVNGIMGLSKGLLETELNTRQLESVNIISRCCDNMVKIINNLLDFSKMSAGKLVLEEHEFAFREFIDKTAAVNIGTINEKGLKLIINIAKDIPDRLIGDELRISQIINNLISNAVKFTTVGQISMEVIKTSEDEEDIELFFMLIDTGIGIGADEVDKLFKSFSQVDASITRRFGGTGLGLKICKDLVELMHGEINVVSEKGKGSTFSFSIQLKKAVYQTPIPSLEYDYSDSNSFEFELDENFEAIQILQFGTKENLREINDTIVKLTICIEMGTWEKAENFASAIKRLISDEDGELKKKAFRIELSVRREDYDKSMELLAELKELIDKVEYNG